jgi:hypothetical protein
MWKHIDLLHYFHSVTQALNSHFPVQDPYLLNFVGINIDLSSALKLVKLCFNEVHSEIVLGKLNLFITYLLGLDQYIDIQYISIF